jgi:delta 1-pyrroline-5-carboxylate dehydrogenase
MSLFETLGFVKKGTYTQEDKPEAPEKPTPRPQNTFNAPVFATTVGNAKVDYLGHFKKLLKDENLPGPDYIEFAEGLDKMNNVPLSEQQKYENVYAVLSSMGLTVEKLQTSAVQYLKKIDTEVGTFNLEYKQKEKTEITEKQVVITTLEKENENLNKKIQDNHLKIAEIRKTMQETQQHLLVEQSAFQQAVNTMSQIINNHLSNIKSYLNVTTTK